MKKTIGTKVFSLLADSSANTANNIRNIGNLVFGAVEKLAGNGTDSEADNHNQEISEYLSNEAGRFKNV